VNNKPPEFKNLPVASTSTLSNGVNCNEFYNMIDQVTAYDPTNNALLDVETTDSIAYDACGNKLFVFVTFKATDELGASASSTVPILVSDEGCIVTNYCFGGTQNANQEWIQKVQFGSINNASGAATYSNFTSLPAKVVAGETYPVTLIPGFSAAPQNETWVIWIDLNRDGVFTNEDERVNLGTSNGMVTGTVHIPLDAKTGNLRMRVAMTRGNVNNACQIFNFGEVEDYTLDVSGPECLPAACVPIYNPLILPWEYIHKVQMGTLLQNSMGTRYSDFRNIGQTVVSRGQTYNLKTYSTSKVGFNGTRYWDVYVDYNRDGDFTDANELAATQAVIVGQASFNLTIPANAVPGLTTMRIVLSRDQNSNDCVLSGHGETEDYSLYIQPTAQDYTLHALQTDDRNDALKGDATLLDWSMQPNPAAEKVVLQYTSPDAAPNHITLMDMTGRVVLQQNNDAVEGMNTVQLNIGQLQPGVYHVVLKTGDRTGQKVLVVVR
jgi:hypothetical protein